MGVRVPVRATAEPEGRRDERPEVLCAVQPADAPISDGCVRAAAHEQPPTDECPRAEPRRWRRRWSTPSSPACARASPHRRVRKERQVADRRLEVDSVRAPQNEQFQNKLCEVLVGGDPSVPYAAPLGPSAAFCFEARGAWRAGGRRGGVDEGKSMLPGSCEGDSDCQAATAGGAAARATGCRGLLSSGKDRPSSATISPSTRIAPTTCATSGKLVCDVCRPTPGASGRATDLRAHRRRAADHLRGRLTALRSLDGRQRERLLTALMKLSKIGGWGGIGKLTECTVYDGSGGANAGDVEALQLELKLNMPHHRRRRDPRMPRAFHLPRQKVVRTVGADGLKEDQAPDPPVAKNFSAAEPPPSLKLQRALVVADASYTFGNPVDDRTCGENKDEVCPKVYLELKTGDVLDLDPPNEDIDRAELFKKMLNEESPSGALGSRHDKIDAPSITSSNAFETSKRFVVEPSIEAARQLLGTVVKLPAGKYDGFGEEEQTRYATYTEPLQWLLARLLSQCTVPGGEWEVEPRGSRPRDDDPETLTQLEVVLRPAAAPMPIQSLPQPVEKLHQERTQCNGGSTFASDGLDPRNCAEIVSVAASCKGKLFSFKREREGEMGKCACCPGDEVDPLPDNDEAVEAATYTQEESDTEEPSERALSERRRERATQCMDALVPFVSNVRLRNDPLARKNAAPRRRQ